MSIRFRRLTRAAIKQLQPGESLRENGIIAECTANRDIRYFVNAMVDGRRIHRAIGFASANVTLTQCEEFWEKARSDARAGRLSLPKGRKLALTVAAAAPQYLERLIQSDGKNLKVKRRHLCVKSHLTKFFGAQRLDQITEFAIDRYKKARKAEGAAAATILASRFDQINFVQLRQFIPKAKGGRRTQPLTAELVRILEHERTMRENWQGWIFPSPHADSSSGHLATMNRPFNDAVKRAGLRGKLTPHTMRHTAITKLIKAGVDLPTVPKISGHKVLAMVLRYAHVHDTHIDKAMTALAHPLPLALPGEFKKPAQ